MSLSNFELKVVDIAKEITIAKLESSSQDSADAESGKKIGEMYLAIYNTILSGLKDEK